MSKPSDAQLQAFRRYEKQLDDNYKLFPISSEPSETAVYALLAAFDSFHIVEMTAQSNSSNISTLQSMKGLEEGLTQAIKWLCHPRNLDLAPIGDNKLINYAGEFILYASKYVDIADFHKMYNKGQAFIDVKEKYHTIKFYINKSEPTVGPMLGFIEDAYDISQRQKRAAEELRNNADEIRRLSNILENIEPFQADGRIIFRRIEALNSKRYNEAFDRLRTGYSDDPFLDPSADLSGFTVQDFDAYWTVLWRWSYIALLAYTGAVLQQGMDQGSTMPTQVICRERFLEKIGYLSGLSTDKTLAITQRLTLDDRTSGGPDIYQQPLICGPELVSWSPRLITLSRPRRNMLRLMARTKSLKEVADTLIGSRERPMLEQFSDLFRRYGYITKIDTKLKIGGMEKGQIDILIYNPSVPNEVMLIEGKAFLGVDEINEVATATDEMIKKAQKQVKDASEFLKSASLIYKKAIYDFVEWDKVDQYYGLVVTPGTEPNEKYDHTFIPAMSLHSLKERLSDRDFRSPQAIWEQSRTKPWLAEWLKREEKYHTISIGKIKYLLPYVKMS